MQTDADRTGALHRLAETFDDWADAGRGDSMARGHWPVARQALDRIGLADVRAFLDLGCGNGYAVRYAAERMPPNGVALGLDVSTGMLAQARAATEAWNIRRKGPAATVRLLQGPFDAIPVPNASLDVVYAHEALYYAPDVGAALEEVQRVLRPAGRFWCCIDYYTENTFSHAWAQKVGVPMTLDSEGGWTARFRSAGFVDVTAERLFDDSPTPPLPQDADADARAAHAALVAWKTEIGTLLIVGRKG